MGSYNCRQWGKFLDVAHTEDFSVQANPQLPIEGIPAIDDQDPGDGSGENRKRKNPQDKGGAPIPKVEPVKGRGRRVGPARGDDVGKRPRDWKVIGALKGRRHVQDLLGYMEEGKASAAEVPALQAKVPCALGNPKRRTVADRDT